MAVRLRYSENGSPGLKKKRDGASRHPRRSARYRHLRVPLTDWPGPRVRDCGGTHYEPDTEARACQHDMVSQRCNQANYDEDRSERHERGDTHSAISNLLTRSSGRDPVAEREDKCRRSQGRGDPVRCAQRGGDEGHAEQSAHQPAHEQQRSPYVPHEVNDARRCNARGQLNNSGVPGAKFSRRMSITRYRCCRDYRAVGGARTPLGRHMRDAFGG